jgi:glycosyltransferase involved in cell wall biosynthesis
MRHRLPGLKPGQEARILATFHDTILLDFPGVLPECFRAEEIETSRRWMVSGVHLAFTSNNTANKLSERVGRSQGPCHLIRLAAEHQAIQGHADQAVLAGLPGQFLLCPANISPHKNHEVLLRGLSPLRDRYPLVLTGAGTSLDRRDSRSRGLAQLAGQLGYRVGKDLFPLGYVSAATYEAILDRCTLLVMPTLGEGGGSWPVAEALLMRKPTVVSDIPVMREFAEAFNVPGMKWFDPASAESLETVATRTLDSLAEAVEEARVRDLSGLRRPWNSVASDYHQLFLQIHDPISAPSVRRPHFVETERP